MYLKLIVLLTSVCALVSGSLKLTVVHTNDMHSRIEETNAQSSTCVGDGSKCYGGFARVKKAVDDVRARATQEGRSTIFLNAGDTFQGTVFYTMYKWRLFTSLIDLLGIDVMSLGNHEFDDGPEGLAPYLKNIYTPVVACNLDLKPEPLMDDTGITPSKILKVDGVDVGVIGYLTPDTEFLSRVGRVKFFDEVESIKKEAARLTEQGVKLIIALGHSGFNMDKSIAANVPEVDLVVGGHTNTFLYTGTPPDIDIPTGLYPTIVEQASGKKVPVVQAYAYTKYLGVLQLDVDDEGRVTHWQGNPILLNHRVGKDEKIEKIVLEKKLAIQDRMSEDIGLTKVFLEGGGECRRRECNLGNLIADSMVDFNARMYVGPGWTNAPIALINSGAVRTSITLDSKGHITYGDLMSTLPFQNTIERVRVKGSDLLLALENSVSRIAKDNLPGAFLQFSGLRVVYDLSQPPMSRVISVMARCGNCSIPLYSPITPSDTYTVLMTSYMADGGDAYTMFSKNLGRTVIGDSDSTVLQEYIQRYSPVYPEISGRVTMLNEDSLKARKARSMAHPVAKDSWFLLLTITLVIPITV